MQKCPKCNFLKKINFRWLFASYIFIIQYLKPFFSTTWSFLGTMKWPHFHDFGNICCFYVVTSIKYLIVFPWLKWIIYFWIIGFTAIWRTKRSGGLPSMYVLHIAVTTNPSETFVFTVIWRTKWHECGIWSKTSVEEFQGMNSSSNFGKL